MRVAPFDGFVLTEELSKDALFAPPPSPYYKYFADAVNAQSTGRWTVTNTSGKKLWTLSNTAHSGPKSWLMGGNYWYGEQDKLQSNGFVIPDNTDGLRLTFYARWNIASGDGALVFWNHGLFSDLVTSFPSGASNPDYPGFTRYSFDLPANFSGIAEDSSLQFYFDSDANANGWGFAIDDVAVYKRILNAPVNVSASDGVPGQVNITWDPNNNGNLAPDEYEIYRSDSQFGTYNYVGTTLYPDTLFVDAPPDGSTYWYKMTSRKVGWADSADSNTDSGFKI